ncbi:unnamed protein product [Discula destructiva]
MLNENTEKLDLPSIAQVPTRGQSDAPYYTASRSTYMPPERLSLPPVNAQQTYTSSTGSPPGSSLGSSISSHAGSQSSYTSAAPSLGAKTPPTPSSADYPGLHGPVTTSGGYEPYPAMNQAPQDPNSMYYQQQQSHISGSAPPPVTSSMAHYPPPPQPLLQPGPQYPPPQHPYSQQYSPYVTSPPAGPIPPGMAPNVLPLPGQQGMPNQYSGFDTTGQVAPPGMKPRVTATLWEDEGSLCFQVEARGICVARREDNHMINGTKLLNVAGMTRGRRDGILKSEKVRHVVKIGPMHLKGVWIPFERALDFANKEKITELLYPLFVHNIGALLYHPTNQNRTTQVMQAAERRKQEQQTQMRNTQPPALPSLQQHHHHMGLPGPPGQPLPSQQHRPSIDRAHTFPTPPTSASSVMGNMGADNYQWTQQQQGMNGSQGTNPMSIDTSLSNTRSMPATPATTPPGSSMQSMPAYPPATQAYDNSRQQYNVPPLQSPYQQTSNTNPQDRSIYGQQGSYVKSEMGPPSSRPSISGPTVEQDQKPSNGYPSQGGEHVTQGGHEEEAEHEHETEYTHDRGTYESSNSHYQYNPPQLPSLQQPEHTHLSPEMAGQGGHQGASGRSTPRSAAPAQAYYPPSGYNTPPRGYNVSSDRGSANGNSGNDVYGSQPDMSNSMQNGYAPLNGTSAGMKRSRDDEDERPLSGGPGMDVKRRKTLALDSTPVPAYQAAPALAAPTRRR